MSKKKRGVIIDANADSLKEEEAAPMAQKAVELIEFDVWWVMRSAVIPKHHMKEVVKADFKGRGLSLTETVETFDKALKAYGL